jgi:hypothetical protein
VNLEQAAALVGFLTALSALGAGTYFIYRLVASPWDKDWGIRKHGVNDLKDRIPRPPPPPPQKPKPWTMRDGFAVSVDLNSEQVTLTVISVDGNNIISTFPPGGALWLAHCLNKAAHSVINCPTIENHFQPGIGFCVNCDPERKKG